MSKNGIFCHFGVNFYSSLSQMGLNFYSHLRLFHFISTQLVILGHISSQLVFNWYFKSWLLIIFITDADITDYCVWWGMSFWTKFLLQFGERFPFRTKILVPNDIFHHTPKSVLSASVILITNNPDINDQTYANCDQMCSLPP